MLLPMGAKYTPSFSRKVSFAFISGYRMQQPFLVFIKYDATDVLTLFLDLSMATLLLV